MEEDDSAIHHEVHNKEYYMNPFWMCRGFRAKFCISWDGRMTLCNTLTAVWEDALSKPLSEAYKDLYDDLKKIQKPQKCENCQYINACFACPSRFLSETGDHEKTNDDVCRIAHYFATLSKSV